MDNFDTLFPTFKGAVEELHHGLAGFAFMIMVLGLLAAAYRGMFGDLSEVIRALVAVGLISVALSFVDDWCFQMGNIINDHVMDGLGSDPRETHTRFGELIADPTEEEEDAPWYETIFNVEAAVAKALAYFFIWIAAKIAWLIVWWAYFIQKALLYFGIAVAPLFLPLLLLNATRGIAVRYILGLFSILLWPLGWAVANLMTDALLKAGAEETIFEFGGIAGKAVFGPQMIFFLLVASLWLVFSTIAAPKILGRVITTGAQIGSAMLGGFMSSVGAGLSGMAGGAAMAGGSGALGTMAAAGIGGGMGFMGASMGSSSLASGAGLIAVAAASGGSGKGNEAASSTSSSSSGSSDYNTKADEIAAANA